VILREKIEIIKDFQALFYIACKTSEICTLVAKKLGEN
jgi:hypothetical protein